MKSVVCNFELHCLELEGSPRYTLPARFLGQWRDYHVFWREKNSSIFHHRKNKKYSLSESEFVLFSEKSNVVFSVSVDAQFRATGVYCNINHPPQKRENSWSWKDLELDVKVVRSFERRWAPIVLDHDEFEDTKALSEEDRVLAEETCHQIVTEVFEAKEIFSNSEDIGERLSGHFFR